MTLDFTRSQNALTALAGALNAALDMRAQKDPLEAELDALKLQLVRVTEERDEALKAFDQLTSHVESMTIDVNNWAKQLADDLSGKPATPEPASSA